MDGSLEGEPMGIREPLRGLINGEAPAFALATARQANVERQGN